MVPDTPTPVDEESVVVGSPKRRCLLFYFYHVLLSFLFLVLLVVFIPRWFPSLGDWLFPYAKETQIEKWNSQLSSLSQDLKPQETEVFNERLHSLEEKVQKTQNVLETYLQKPQEQSSPGLSEAKTTEEQSSEKSSFSSLSEKQAYFIEALLLCQEIEGRLLTEQEYQTPLALLAALLRTPEEKAWLSLLTSNISALKEPTEILTTNWPSWLKPLQNFFTIQPLTDRTSPEPNNKKMALQKLKDILIENRQKASLAVTEQGARS